MRYRNLTNAMATVAAARAREKEGKKGGEYVGRENSARKGAPVFSKFGTLPTISLSSCMSIRTTAVR